MKKTFHGPLLFLVGFMLIISGCSVTKRHYAPGYHVEWHHNGAREWTKVKDNQPNLAENREEVTDRVIENTQAAQPSHQGYIKEQLEVQSRGVEDFVTEETPRSEDEEVGKADSHQEQWEQSPAIQDDEHAGVSEEQPLSAPPTDNNIFAILGLIFSIFPSFWLLGVVFSIIGLVQIRRDGGEGKKLAVAGLIICGIWLLLFLLYFVIYAVLLSQTIR